MSEAQTYCDGLIGQGYSAADAVTYTQQHFPDFTGAAPAAAAPAMVMVAESPYDASTDANVAMNMDDGPSRYYAPFIAVLLILISLFLPYVSLGGLFEVSGFEMLGVMGDMAGMAADGGDGDGDADVDSGGFELIIVPLLMFGISPLFYILTAIIGGILAGLKKNTTILGGIHLGYFGLFFLLSLVTDMFGFHVHDLAGMGFWIGSLAAIGFMIKK
jgi:hypothetical protein